MRLSTVIPLHELRSKEALERCLDSALTQVVRDSEVVVASQLDRDYDWSRWLDRGLRVEYTPPCETIAADWNAAISLAQGEWIHLLDQDDWLEPRFAESLPLDTPAEMIATAFVVVGADGNEKTRVTALPVPIYQSAVVACPFQPSATVIRRSAYEALGGYVGEIPDWDFYLRFLLATMRVRHVGECLVVHVEGEPKSFSGKPISEQLERLARQVEQWKKDGIQRDALIANVRNMTSVAVRHALGTAADDGDGMPLFDLAVRLERQCRAMLEGK